MCHKRRSDIEDNAMEDSDSDSDVSMTDSDSSENEITVDQNETIESDAEEEKIEDEEEDEVIKAIRKNAENKRDHPPPIICEDFITDISFHPCEDIIAVASVVGDVTLYKYTNEKNTLLDTHELHSKSCRDVEFSFDGKIMFSASKDKCIMLTDVATGKLNRFYENSHDVPVYCLTVLDENLFATGL